MWARGCIGFQKSDSDSMYELMEGKINDALKKTFNPEFLNRVGDAIIFHALDKEHIAAIIDIRLENSKRVWFCRTSKCELRWSQNVAR